MPDSNTSSPVAPFSPFAILRNLVRVAPLTVAPSASVRETLTKLDAARIDAIVVLD